MMVQLKIKTKEIYYEPIKNILFVLSSSDVSYNTFANFGNVSKHLQQVANLSDFLDMLQLSCTELPTKDETSEMTVQNYTACFLIVMIPCNFQLACFFSKSLNEPLIDNI